jgi:glycosyltransferase involved in cell wall biosynthesis
MATDVLLVSLGTTAGLRESDAGFAAALQRAGAGVEVALAPAAREPRTFALTDLAQARAARRAARDGIAAHRPRAIVYSTVTAALLWPRPGAIRVDAPAAANRPGRHGLWQRPQERRRFRQAPLLVPLTEEALALSPAPRAEAEVVPIPVEPSGALLPEPERDLAAVTYAADAHKKGLDRVLYAWQRARGPGEELVVAGGARAAPSGGVRFAGALPAEEYRGLVRRARVFLAAPRWEDYGLAQLEALADGCRLVTTPGEGPYAALPLARELDPRLVSDDLADAVRAALDEPVAGYAERARAAVAARFGRATVERTVAERLLPRLLG